MLEESIQNKEQILSLPERKEDFVIGGFWAFEDKLSKSKLSTIAKNANREKYSNNYLSFVTRETSSDNENRAYGLFQTKVKPKAKSLALLMALAVNQNQSCVKFFTFENENKEQFVWTVVIDNGLVLPDGDIITTVQESFQIQEDYEKNLPSFSIERIDVKDSYNYIIDAVQSLPKKVLNKTIISNFETNNKKLMMIVLGVLGVLALLFVAFNYYQSYQMEQQKIAEKLRIEKMASQKLSALKKSEFPPVWMKQPTAKTVIDYIVATSNTIPIHVNYWSLEKVFFDMKNKSQMMTYTRDGKVLYTTPPGKVHLKKPFESIVSSPIRLSYEDRENGIMKLKNAEKWIMQITIGRPFKSSAFNLHPRQSKTVVIDKQNKVEVKVVASYQHFSFSLNGIKSLHGLGDLLNAPGVVIESVEKTKESSWNIKGVLYVIP